MEEKKTPPPGMWEDANGAWVPVSKIKDVDKDRHRVVLDLCQAAIKESGRLFAFKSSSMAAIEEFIARSLAEYDVQAGGKKGNVTLTTFDGRFKIIRHMQDKLVFDERLQAAKALIDECVKRWSKGSNDNIKALVVNAFQVDREGRISTERVLGLRRVKIDDPTWRSAMDAISDSIKVVSTKPYVRFYQRDDTTGAYVPIPLDVAAL